MDGQGMKKRRACAGKPAPRPARRKEPDGKPCLGDDYELLDSGGGRKYERFGPYRLIRPSAQAIWRPQKDTSWWDEADASFDRRRGNQWRLKRPLPEEWSITVCGMRFRLSPTDFGHLGIFPEQRDLWGWITSMVEKAHAEERTQPVSVLNLFAYSGGATMAAARAGARVCHVDASKGMVKWARENASLNGLDQAPIQWVVEDVNKFLDREIRRGKHYDAIILDPPTFGHGRRSEIYKIDRELASTLEKCWALMSDDPCFLLLTSHTPSLTPVALANFLRVVSRSFRNSCIEEGEMLLTGSPDVLPVPSGTYARWFPGPCRESGQ